MYTDYVLFHISMKNDNEAALFLFLTPTNLSYIQKSTPKTKKLKIDTLLSLVINDHHGLFLYPVLKPYSFRSNISLSKLALCERESLIKQLSLQRWGYSSNRIW